MERVKLVFKEKCKKIKMLLVDCDGVLTDGRIILGSDSMEIKFFYAADGMGLMLWRAAGNMIGCITGRKSESMEKRAEELKFHELHQNVQDKGAVLDEILKKYDLDLSEVAYIGDDVNDLPVGMRVGLFFTPANRNTYVDSYSDYCLENKGGHGAVREAIDLMLIHQGKLDQVIKSKYLNK